MKDIIIKKFPHILHGGDYNPDQWKDYPEILKEDMRLMQKAHCNEMTVAIFSWCMLEPEEGKFDFSFLDRVMDDIYNAGGRVILATPSGARPVWLSEKYPEVLRVDNRGHRNNFGGRHNHCNTSPVYREKVAIINRKLAERYKDHPALIAWHISNEFGNANIPECYCPLCVEAFRDWLKNKYGTIEKLNHEWWNAFWGHTYQSFEQIDPPGPLTDGTVHARNLDWKRFVTDQTIAFIDNEAAPLREITPDIPVTTNLMGFYHGLDYHKLSKHIDFISVDNYPEWRGDEASDINTAVFFALVNDLMRSLKKRPFLLMESTPSLVNWHRFNKLKRPGMNMLSSLQAIAHGSDSVQYFQWRKGRGGSEKFHGAVVDHAGHENTRVFREISQLGERLERLDEIVGTMPEAKVALLYDWDNRWAVENAQGFSNADKKMMPTIESFYRPLWSRGIDVDVIGCEDEFSAYGIIIAPMLYMIDDALCSKLCEYVKCGGRLVCTYMTGMVDRSDLCHLGGWPCGELKEVFGIINEEIDTLYPGEENSIITNDGETFSVVDYCELIYESTAEVKARYSSDFYEGLPAFTVNSYGEGKAYYIACRDKGDFTDRVISQILDECGISSVFDGALPYGVTAHSRCDGDKKYVFLENYSHSEARLVTEKVWKNVETGEEYSGSLTLSPLETLIILQK